MEDLHHLLARGDVRHEAAVHEREVAVREARAVPGDPRAKEHLGEDGHQGQRPEPEEAAISRARGQRAVSRPLGDEDRGREHH